MAKKSKTDKFIAKAEDFQDPEIVESYASAAQAPIEQAPDTSLNLYPTIEEINEVMENEYGFCRNNVVEINRMILRELVIARLERRKHG